MKKIFAFIMAIALLTTMLPMAAHANDLPKVSHYEYRNLYVVVDDAPIRMDKSKSADVLKRLSKGTIIKTYGWSKNSLGNVWYAVKIPGATVADKNQHGWIFSDNIVKTSINTEKGNGTYKGIIKKNGVPIRTGPSGSLSANKALHAGAVVTVHKTIKNETAGTTWYQLSDGEFVFSDNIVVLNFDQFKVSTAFSDSISAMMANVQKALKLANQTDDIIGVANGSKSLNDILLSIIKDEAKNAARDIAYGTSSEFDDIGINGLIVGIDLGTGNPREKAGAIAQIINNNISAITGIRQVIRGQQSQKVKNALKVFDYNIEIIASFKSLVITRGFAHGMAGDKRFNIAQLGQIQKGYDNIFDIAINPIDPKGSKGAAKEIIVGLRETLMNMKGQSMSELYSEAYNSGKKYATNHPELFNEDATVKNSSESEKSTSASTSDSQAIVTPPPVSNEPTSVDDGTWSEWSAWQIEPIAASATVDVETATQYRIYRFKCTNDNWAWPYWNIGCKNCGTLIRENSFEMRWDVESGTSMTTGKYDEQKGKILLNGWDHWFYEINGQPTRTVYRSRSLIS